MTRDIIETNGFIVVVEYSIADKTIVEKCEVNDRAVGFAFYGSGEVQLEMKCGSHLEYYNNTSGMAISFFGNSIEFTHTISHKTPLQSITVFSTLHNIKTLPDQEQQFFQDHLGELVNPATDFVKDADDIADVVVASLTDDKHTNKVYELTGPRLLTFRQVIAEIAQATGREIAFESLSLDAYVKMLREYKVPEDYIWLVNYLFSEVLDGRNASITSDVEKILGRKAKDFSDYVKETAPIGVWNG